MKPLMLLFLLTTSALTAQIQGLVHDTEIKPLSFVNIYLENSITGTTSNDQGAYELPLSKKGTYTLVFQSLGYKTLKKTITIDRFPAIVDVQLTTQEVVLDAVHVSSKENPAHRIVRNAIAHKKENKATISQYTADFYSRGVYKIKNAPKKILGQTLGDLGGGLDSTRSGIVYLSETVSKIAHQKPDNFKEFIVASKVSGSDNGVSFNSAKEVNFNLYNNTVDLGSKIISPLNNAAFNYYNFTLAGSFYAKSGQLVNKIQLTPKRKNDRVFSGFIYITEDEWALYGSDISVTGKQANLPMVEVLHLKQNCNYVPENNAWVVISQTIDFKIGMFGIHINGRFSSAYSNYNFNPAFTKDTFGNEILSFAENATKKDTEYWNRLRPVSLTTEEIKDYVIKDSIQIIRKSKPYLDSINKQQNKFTLLSPITGYTYRNSHKKWRISFGSPVRKINFNSVQGWHTAADISYTKWHEKPGKWERLQTVISYGFSDKKVRPSFRFSKKWNNISKPLLTFSGGIKTAQFNEKNPVSPFLNTVSILFFEENYLKIYEKTFAKATFSKEVFNGFRLASSIEYTHRKPLLNTTNYSAVNVENTTYTSNNPLAPTLFEPAFAAHSLWIYTLDARIYFDQKYVSYPNQRFAVKNPKYPSLRMGYKKTFGSKNAEQATDFFHTRIQQTASLGNSGVFSYNIRGGAFVKPTESAFIDYAHVNGGQFPVLSSKEPLNRFNLLPHYAFSTNKSFVETHAAHHFKGFILNKIPLLNQLNFHLVLSGKILVSAQRKPYTEWAIGVDNIGWGKWRFLRVDYVRATGGVTTQKQQGFVFRFNLFN